MTPITQPGDLDALIGRTARGDRAAFRILQAATAPRLFGLCLHVLDDRAEAEVAVFDICLTIWHRAAEHPDSGLDGMTWLTVIARDHLVVRSRAARAARGAPDDLALLADLPAVRSAVGPLGGAAQADAQDRRPRIELCLDRLDPDRAEMLRQVWFDGLTAPEIGQRLGLGPEATRRWLRTSLAHLSRCLGA
ncbi:MAG: RNA polymerase subunit sigma [Rubellimicrobium sp.]|nr:RNA polymerase subunit sigma [Rubellimicrobium sp.]